ncbi:MAG TPA: hypothetical protein VF941_17410, partial [Clostridia bacterium]
DFVSFIPSALLPDKPISTAETYLLYNEKAINGTSITFGLYGNALLHMGVFGILFIWLVYFYLGTLLIKLDRKELRGYKDFLVIFVLCYQIIWLRGGFFALRLLELLIVFFIGVGSYNIYRGSVAFIKKCGYCPDSNLHD